MIIHEYVNENLDVNKLFEILENLREDKGADIFHIRLDNKDECERFQRIVSQNEANGGWHFESSDVAPMFWTAMYY